MEPLGIIILAGGKSSRMGEDKGLMTLFGRAMIGYVLDKALELSPDIIIVSDNPNYAQLGFEVVKDKYKAKGPLAGIFSGLSSSPHDRNLVLSCDIPYVKIGLLKYILYQSEGYDITVPKHKDRIHPLMGVYYKSCVVEFQKRIEQDKLKITDAFEALNVNIVEADEFDDVEFKNLNSKKDIVPF